MSGLRRAGHVPPPPPPPPQEAGVVSLGPETLFLAQGHTASGDRASPPSGSRSLQVPPSTRLRLGGWGLLPFVSTKARGPAGMVWSRFPKEKGGGDRSWKGRDQENLPQEAVAMETRQEQKANYNRAGAATWLTCKLQLGL